MTPTPTHPNTPNPPLTEEEIVEKADAFLLRLRNIAYGAGSQAEVNRLADFVHTGFLLLMENRAALRGEVEKLRAALIQAHGCANHIGLCGACHDAIDAALAATSAKEPERE